MSHFFTKNATPLSANYEIVTLNKKIIVQMYCLAVSVEQLHVYLFIFWRNYEKNKFSSAQWAKFRLIWIHCINFP